MAGLPVISFHSLEDRIVKQFIAQHSREVYDRRAPFAAPVAMKLRSVARIFPSDAEVAANPRSRSAVLRVAERTETTWSSPMARLNILLLIAVLATALLLVHMQYRSRQLFNQKWSASTPKRTASRSSNERLQVEKRAQATPLRVEKLAKDQLKMRTATPAITLYVRQDGTVIPAVVSPVAPVPMTVGGPKRGHT